MLQFVLDLIFCFKINTDSSPLPLPVRNFDNFLVYFQTLKKNMIGIIIAFIVW